MTQGLPKERSQVRVVEGGRRVGGMDSASADMAIDCKIPDVARNPSDLMLVIANHISVVVEASVEGGSSY